MAQQRKVRCCATLALMVLAAPMVAQQSVSLQKPDVVLGQDSTWFSGVVGARIAGGRLLVGDQGNYRVAVFSLEGKFLRSEGRKGGGPGEFQAIRSLVTCEDGTALIYDASANAITKWTDKLTEARSPWPVGARLGRLLWCDGQGNTLVAVETPGSETRPWAGLRFVSPTYVLRVRATRLDTVATAPEGRTFYVSTSNPSFTDVPLATRTLFAVGGKTLYAVNTHTGTVIVSDVTAGKQLRSFALDLPQRDIRGNDWAQVIAERLAEEAIASDRFRRTLDEAPPEARFPKVDRAHADDQGRLWVRTTESLADGRYRIYSASGFWVGEITLPRGVQIMDIRARQLVGLERLEDGAEKVVLYRLPQELDEVHYQKPKIKN